jgi:hypothetical protein
MWPGYYWLAYDWENLFWSCAFCNSSKSDLFPLEDPASRARQHGMRLEDETPTILKPNGDQNPRDHLAFHMEIPVGLTELGRKTIEVLRLDSPAHQERLAYLNRIRDACEIYIKLIGSADPIAREYAERAFQKLLEAVRPEKPYSAMVADYLAANPLPDHPA